MEAMIYLDTHAVVWLYAGEVERFPKSVFEKSVSGNTGHRRVP